MEVVENGPVRWAGPALIGIGLLHTVVMVVMFHGSYWEIVSAGLINTVVETADPMWGAAFWALQFGFMLMLLGLLLPADRQPVSRWMGLGLLLVVGLGIAIMPAGGFWFGLPVAIVLLMRG